jgi:4-amino-4-deoxy-L-arabinose transferase-like glycosyltransferase
MTSKRLKGELKIFYNWKFQLGIITLIAIVIRSIPSWIYPVWGNDFGIYYGLTNTFIKNKELFLPYTGWGESYQYFPMLYLITASFYWITGIDLLWLMPKLIPIFGGLTALLLFFLVDKLLASKRIALIAAAFLSVAPIHVYQTSLAAPLTIGHFFMLLSLLLFVLSRKNSKYLPLLFISTGCLILSHHLTTYFYLLVITAVIFISNFNAKEWTPKLRQDILYILLAITATFCYWSVVATPVLGFIEHGTPLGVWQLMLICYIAVFFSFLVIWIKRKYNLFWEVKRPNPREDLTKFIFSNVLILGIISLLAILGVSWANLEFTPLFILCSLPLIALIGFCAVGFRHAWFVKNGDFVKGWLLAILLSLLYSVLTWNRVNFCLFPERHLEYIIVPLCIIAAVGVSEFFREHHPDKKSIFIGIILLLVITNGAAAYETRETMSEISGIDEACSEADLEVIGWMEGNLTQRNLTIATDHRLAMLLQAKGFNTTFDKNGTTWYPQKIWTAENLTECLEELNLYGKIYYVFIDDIMKNKSISSSESPHELLHMTNESYKKFNRLPFKLLYRNESIRRDEKLNWAELYEVKWDWIEEVEKVIDKKK